MDPVENSERIYCLDSMPNFRVVYENVKSPKLFRSSRPDFLEGSDLQKFNSLGIKSIIDLRSHSAYKKIDAVKEIDTYYQPFIVSLPKKRKYLDGEIVHCRSLDKQTFFADKKEIPANKQGGHRKHIFFDFMNPSVMMYFLKSLRWYLMIYAFLVMIYDIIFKTGFKNFIHFLSKNVLNEIGPAKVLSITMDYNENLVCSVLKLLTYSDHVPALVNCSHGKDRSGIVSALVLWILGKSEDFILQDYSMSQEGLMPMKDRLYKEVVEDHGLDPKFCEVNPTVLKEILDHLKEKYGSIEDYLENIGFGAEEQRKLRENFGVKEA